MSSHLQTVYTNSIYHGLPILSDQDAALGLRAIVVGASGMSGQSMIDVLAKNSQRWKRVYALSRRSPRLSSETTNVLHVAVDFLKQPKGIAERLIESGVKADIVFFFGYVQLRPEERAYSSARNDSAEKLTEVNGRLLQNFLAALDLASITPIRILLQTGLKYYGAHHGPANIPFDEHDPRVNLLGEWNFYYRQIDILSDYCKDHPSTSYTVTAPSWILGCVEASDMTTFYPLAVYASVQKKLGQPLAFPGDTAAWEKIMPMSSSVLNSLFHEWVVLEENAGGELFNIVDDSEFTWMKAWPMIAGWFDMQWTPPVEDDKAYTVVEMPLKPRGYGPPGYCTSSFSLVEWFKQPRHRDTWRGLMQEHSLSSDPFAGSEGMFAALQFSLTMSWSWATKMDKARKFGWHGHVDTMESMREVFEKFVEFKMIPPMSW